MATFDAGSVEARLTLDRSAFQRDLREARQEAESFENDTYTARFAVHLDEEDYRSISRRLDNLGGTAYVHVYLSNVQEVDDRLRSLGGYVSLTVDLDSTDIERLQDRLAALDARVNIGVNIPDAELDAFKAKLAALDATTHIRVDVDRTELDALKAELAALSGHQIDVRVNIGNRVVLASLKRQLDALNPATINVDLDITAALAQLNVLEYAILFAKTVGRDWEIDVDTAAAHAKLAALQGALAPFRRRTINIGVRDGFAESTRRGGLFMLALKAILALAPLLSGAIAGVVAVVVAFGGALVAAGGAALVFGAAVAGAISRFNEIEDPLNSTNSAVRFLAQNLESMKAAWSAFQDATQDDVFLLLGQGARIVASVIPRLLPIFEAMVPVIHDALHSVEDFLNGLEGARMFEFFRTVGVTAFKDLAASAGNMLLFFGRLFEAFGPFITELTGGLTTLTAGWAEWAGGLSASQGFTDFLNYVRDVGPRILDMLGSLVDAFINIGRAVAPLAGPMADAFRIIFDLIAGMDPSILGAIAVGIGAVAAATKLWGIAIGIINTVMNMSPWGIVLRLVLALAGGIAYLLATNEGFREALGKIWDWIVDKIQWVYEVLLGGSIIPDIVNGIVEWFGAIWGLIGPIWDAVVTGIVTVWNVISVTVSTVVQAVVAVITVVWGTIQGIVSFYLNTWLTIITTAWTVIKTVVETVVNVVKNVIQVVWSVIAAIISGYVNAWRAIIETVWGAVTGIVSGVVGGVKNAIEGLSSIAGRIGGFFRGAYDAAVGALSNLVGFVGGIPGRILGALGDMGRLLFNAGKNVIQGLIDGIKNMAGAVGDAVRGAVQKAKDFLPFSPAKEGPFSGSGNPYYSGQSIARMLAEGIDDNRDRVTIAMNRLTTGAAAPMVDVSATGGGGSRAGGAGVDWPSMGALVDAINVQTATLTREFARANQAALTLKRQGAIA